jgi:hypothetical protein
MGDSDLCKCEDDPPLGGFSRGPKRGELSMVILKKKIFSRTSSKTAPIFVV